MGVIGLKKKSPEELQKILENWSKDTDPAVMAGDEWSDSKKLEKLDDEGKADFRERKQAFGAMFMHPTHDVSYNHDQE